MLTPANSYALVGFEAGIGQRTNDVVYDAGTETDKVKSISGSELSANLLFDPIPAVPVAFGLALESYSYNRASVLKDQLSSAGLDDSNASDTMTGMLYGPMLKVWVPTPYVKPYLKYSYLTGQEVGKSSLTTDATISSQTVEVTQTSKSTYTHTAGELALGVSFSFLKIAAVSLEYALHYGENKIKSFSQDTSYSGQTATSTIDDLSDDAKEAKKAEAKIIRLSVSAGI